MNRDMFLSRLEQTLEVSPGSLREEDEVRRLENWDSLRLLEIITLVDEDFNVQLDANRLAKCNRVQEILLLIEESVRPHA